MKITEEIEILEEAINTKNNRKWWLAGILSFYIPGLGQIYNGHFLKGISLYIIMFSCTLLIFEFSLIKSFNHLLLFLLIFFLGYSYTVIDAIISSLKTKAYHFKKFNRVSVYVLLTIVFYLLPFYYIILGNKNLEAFKIPTDSSLPGIEIGDFIMCDKESYTHSKPDYGHQIAFKKDGIIYSYRVVGLPKDTLKIEKNRITINSTPCEYDLIKKAKKIKTEFPFVADEFSEKFPNGYKHHIYVDSERIDSARTYNTILGNDEYYVLGDNRDRSLDSRYIGAIHHTQIVGRMIFVYWSNNKDRIGLDL